MYVVSRQSHVMFVYDGICQDYHASTSGIYWDEWHTYDLYFAYRGLPGIQQTGHLRTLACTHGMSLVRHTGHQFASFVAIWNWNWES